ncbi:MAG: biotin--[acetyl-CoA-carboxylase] ligase [Bacteroidales bacterium]|jgi:BirA family biotin operon repressor/biotin-[acetyl-CoA-carboxylase] ligase|nr:biotin--[acetyl-CoA-carboxylase] ligase [Bacteroidales bacterium]
MKSEQFIFIPEVVSTNDSLTSIVNDKKLSNSNLEDFTVLFTDYQIGGKGLSGNVWESNSKENILASFYLNSAVLPKDQFMVNIFFSLSVRKMLAKYLPLVQIKWPNDIYVHHNKIAGILIEHHILGETLDYTIAGVGINLNQTQFPSSVPNPTSLKLETGYDNGRITLIKELFFYANNYYQLLVTGKYEQLRKEYFWHLYRFNEVNTYLINNELIAAKIVGIDGYGRLQLEMISGEILTCGYKEVRFY